MRLTCLDDDPRIESVLGRFLRRLGHSVEFHTSVASFKTALSADLPELVLLDLGLGQDNGIDVMQWLAQAHPHLPVILLSGHGDSILDTARRVGRSTGVKVLGSVSKARMVQDLPPLIAPAHSEHSSAPGLDIVTTTPLTPAELEQLIRRGAITPYFQPIVAPGIQHLVGAEALARLRLPDGRVMNAGEFIPLAESNDLLFPLTEALFRELLNARPILAPLGMRFLSVNLSPLILEERRSLELVRDLVDGMQGVCALKIEITETAASNHPDLMQSVAARIHLMGVSLAIDDFGVGYSSMRALAELPFDTLKIDMSFVSEMMKSNKALKLLRAMVHFGQALDLEVVAEGVETDQQRALLIDAQVDLAQGYLFGAPMPADRLARAFAPGGDAGAGTAADAPTVQRSSASTVTDGHRYVMVIDDDPRMLHATARLLSAWGYRCDAYTDARAALVAAQQAPPALVVMDIYMPDLDGFELLKRFRKIAPDARLLAVSGDFVRGYPTNVLKMSRAMGADAVLQKPIGPERLRPIIQRLIGPPGRRRGEEGSTLPRAAAIGDRTGHPQSKVHDEDAVGD
jgi:EAL domain-containing protein (putative c-di-GMP-specific phosphodiesterase class I)/DNA-binding response OmpR family regulator